MRSQTPFALSSLIFHPSSLNMHFHRVHQELAKNPIPNIPEAVFGALDAAALNIPDGACIALTAGSRGIDQIDTVIKAVGDWFKSKGALPFIVPCMGSHNGATAEGQRAMLETLGITETAMEMPIRSSMEVVKLGEVPQGEVCMDKYCYASDGVFLINRIKLHTAFSGPLQSGLTKMMVVGMGKLQSATTFHSCPTPIKSQLLMEMGQCVLQSGKIFGGLALLEDGLDQLAEIHALKPDHILQEEPKLLERHRHYFPSLPVEELNLLVVDEIGKTYSGTGVDTNVIGYRGIKGQEDLKSPRIKHLAFLNLHPDSQGNATGIGLGDFCTRRLRDAMDEDKTFTNVFTTGDMARMKIPATLENDEILINKLAERFGTSRWMIIPNTLHLHTLYISPDLAEELNAHPRCSVDPTPLAIEFKDGRHQLSFA